MPTSDPALSSPVEASCHCGVEAEVEQWLTENWDPQLPPDRWLELVVDNRWSVPTWNHPLGRGASAEEAKIIQQAFARRKASGSGQDRHNLWANTLLAYGSTALQEKLLRPLLLDKVAMCLLYSEPGAGSDLAGLQTRAERDGGEWIINGQKVWTSGARAAEYGMLIARTNLEVPKHAGISFFWFPMRQSGVEVRPLRQITGESHFNEVFITDARVPNENMLGAPGEGWKVLQTALAYERSLMGDSARGPRQPGVGEKSTKSPDKPKTSEILEPVGNAGTVEAPRSTGATQIDLWEMAKRYGVLDDPQIRQEIAQVHTLRKVNEWNASRAKAQLKQGTSSPILSLGKLAMSTILHRGAYVQARIVGAQAMLTEPAYPDASDANFLMLNAYFTSIGGGTDQIQKNIIGERVLGLPKEPELDRDIPFSQVKKAIR